MKSKILPFLFKKHMLLLLLAFFITTGYSQTASVGLQQLHACPGDAVMTTIYAEHLYDISAISLYVGYDTNVLEYTGHSNVHPQFSGMITNAMVLPATQVGIIWSNISGGTLVSGNLIELNFIYKGGSCPLTFNPGGEIMTVDFVTIDFDTVNGSAAAFPPYILNEPQNTTVMETGNAQFSIEAQQADTYQWQANISNGWFDLENNDTYQNVNSSMLSISNVSLDMDNNWYRCFLTADAGCEIYSDSARLNILPLLSVQLSLPELLSCYDEPLAVPIEAIGMINMTGFEMHIAYDPEVASFNGLDNVNPLIQDITYTIQSSPVHHVSISWASAAPVSLTDGMVFEMLMQYATGTTSLAFLSSSQVLGEGGLSYDLFFQNGEIGPYPHPNINTQPVSQTVYEGGTAVFSLQAQQANAYQWYAFNNGNWDELTDGNQYIGTNTPDLTVYEATPELNQKQYKCFVTGSFCGLFSEEAFLTVLPVPEASLSLPDTLSCPESVISLPLQAAGLDDITAFELSISFDPAVSSFVQLADLHPDISSCTAIVYAEPEFHVRISWAGAQAVDLPDGAFMSLVFDYDEGNSPFTFLADSYVLNSDQVAYEITVNDGVINTHEYPVITMQPQNRVVSTGGTAQFQVGAANTTNYQWQVSQDNGDTWQNLNDALPYSGVQTAVLTISPADMGLDQNQYKCIVSGEYCVEETTSATLTVLPEMSAFLMLPDTASCLNEEISIPLYGAGMQQVLSFEIVLAFDGEVVEFIEIIDIHPLLTGLEINLETSPETQLLLSWEGSEAISLPDTEIFKLRFVYSEGTTQLAFMDQTIILNEALSPFVLTTLDGQISAHEYPEIVSQPQNQITYIGTSTQFNVQANNAQTYQWFVSENMGTSWEALEDDSVFSGSQSSTLTILNVNLSMDQQLYRCYVSAEYCGAYTNAASLTVLPEIYAELIIDDTSTCLDEPVNIALQGFGLFDVSEFGFYIAYDPAVAEFLEIVNPHPLIENLEVVIQGAPNPQISVSWSGVASVNLPDGVLFELRFHYTEGEMVLDLLEESYAFSEDLLTYNFMLISGLLSTYPYPNIVTQPQDVHVEPGDMAVFNINAIDVVGFQWFESRDNGISWLEIVDDNTYMGSQTEVLTVGPVELSFDQYQYRCLLIGTYCDLTSLTAKLIVDTLTYIHENNFFNGINHSLSSAQFRGHDLILDFADSFTGSIHFRIFDLTGRLVHQTKQVLLNQKRVTIEMGQSILSKQIYLVQGIIFDSDGNQYSISAKFLNGY